MTKTTLNCPHCGKEPADAIRSSVSDLPINEARGVLTNCDHCNGEIEIQVSKEAWVQRRSKGYSDLELDQRAD